MVGKRRTTVSKVKASLASRASSSQPSDTGEDEVGASPVKRRLRPRNASPAGGETQRDAISNLSQSDVAGDEDCLFILHEIDSRFSTSRVYKLVQNLKSDQIEFVQSSPFASLLHIKKFHVPLVFLRWIVEHTCHTTREIVVGNSRIPIVKGMVNKAIGIEMGLNAVETSSNNVAVKDKVTVLKAKYRDALRSPFKVVEKMCLDDHNKESFLQSFYLIVISSIFHPRKDNMVGMDYLFSLVDVDKVKDYDWAEFILDIIFKEVSRYKSLPAGTVKHYMEGFVQLLAIIYLDFVDLSEQSRKINYGVPRVCNLEKDDFSFLMSVDKNGDTDTSFGALRIREVSETLYCDVWRDDAERDNIGSADMDTSLADVSMDAADPANPETVHHASGSHGNEDANVRTEEPDVTFEDLDDDIKSIVQSINLKWAADFKRATDSYGSSMNRIVTEFQQCNRQFQDTLSVLHRRSLKDAVHRLKSAYSEKSRRAGDHGPHHEHSAGRQETDDREHTQPAQSPAVEAENSDVAILNKDMLSLDLSGVCTDEGNITCENIETEVHQHSTGL